MRKKIRFIFLITLFLPLFFYGCPLFQESNVPVFSREQSYKLVNDKILKTDKDIKYYRIIGPVKPLAKGSNISPNEIIIDEKKTIKLENESWFFILDTALPVRLEHEMMYFFVNTKTGEITEKLVNSWPVIDGQPYNFNVENNNSAEILYQSELKPFNATFPTGTIAEVNTFNQSFQLKDHVSNCNESKTYALLVQAENSAPMDADIAGMTELLTKAYKVKSTDMTLVKTSDFTDPKKEIQAQISNLYARMNPCDTYFLYISGHGNAVGNLGFYPKAVKGTWSQIVPMTAADFNIAGCPTCHIKIIVDACHSGHLISSDSPIYSFRKPIEDKKGTKGSIFTATGDDELALYYYKPTYKRDGGVFTQLFLDAYKDAPNSDKNGDNAVSEEEAFDYAVNKEKDYLVEREKTVGFQDGDNYAGNEKAKFFRWFHYFVSQRPQMWVKKLPAGEGCNIPPVTTTSYPTPGVIPTPTSTPTPTATPTPRKTARPTPTPVPTPKPTKTPVITLTPTATATAITETTPTPSPSPSPSGQSVTLSAQCGGLSAGTVVSLSRISGSRIGSPEAGCDARHLHGNIIIDDGSVCNDPNPTGCGWGILP